MSKRPDFAVDLNRVKLDVSENVSDILTAAKERVAQRNLSPRTPREAVVEMPQNDGHASKKNQRTSTLRKSATRPEPSEALVFKDVATKLTVQTKESLRRAALLQKANGLKPDTEYAITNEAVEDWLKRHGYARRLKSEDPRQHEAPLGDDDATGDDLERR
jgi:hypothetical protein